MKILNHSKVSIASVDYAALILRLVAGFLMFYGHGFPKLKMLFGGGEIQFVDFLGLGVMFTLILTIIAEVVCALFFSHWTVYKIVCHSFDNCDDLCCFCISCTR